MVLRDKLSKATSDAKARPELSLLPSGDRVFSFSMYRLHLPHHGTKDQQTDCHVPKIGVEEFPDQKRWFQWRLQL